MSFSEKMHERLSKLSNSTSSIQTLSLWFIYHSFKNSDIILQTWLKEVKASMDGERLLALVNLANDVIQNSRKKNPEFMLNFFEVLHPAFMHISEFGDEHCKKMVDRVLTVWKDRNVYSSEKLITLSQFLTDNKAEPASPTSDQEGHDRCSPQEASSPVTPPGSVQKIRHEYQTFAVMTTDLVNILRRLEDPASADAKIRQLIASYPEAIANPILLKQIKTNDELQSLTDKINEASPVVDAYCTRLKDELKDRQNAIYLLMDYLKALTEANGRNKSLGNSVRKKIARLDQDKKEVAKHIESLPDLNEIFGENTSSSLPTLGELFT